MNTLNRDPFKLKTLIFIVRSRIGIYNLPKSNNYDAWVSILGSPFLYNDTFAWFGQSGCLILCLNKVSDKKCIV